MRKTISAPPSWYKYNIKGIWEETLDIEWRCIEFYDMSELVIPKLSATGKFLETLIVEHRDRMYDINYAPKKETSVKVTTPSWGKGFLKENRREGADRRYIFINSIPDLVLPYNTIMNHHELCKEHIRCHGVPVKFPTDAGQWYIKDKEVNVLLLDTPIL